MKKLALALVAVATMTSTAAMADVYVSAGVGQGHVKLDCEGAPTCDKSGTASKFAAGYDFGNGFAAEAVYLNFGKAKIAEPGLSLSAKATAIGVGGVYTLNFNDDWNMAARLGLANVKVKASATVSGLGSGSISESNTKPYFGLGLGYNLTKATRFELAADFSKGEIEGGSASVRAITFGVRQSF
jgi:OmpA-OmpF porin, OOP family